MEERASSSVTPPGCLESVDRTTGLEYWNGLSCLFLDVTAF